MTPNKPCPRIGSFMAVMLCWTLSGPAAAVGIPADAQTPGQPGNLRADPVNSSTIDLSWTAPTTGTVDHYEIRVSTTGGAPWNKAGTTKSTVFTHANLVAGRTYHYRVAACGSASGHCGTPATKSATTPRSSAPGLPRNLTATPVGDIGHPACMAGAVVDRREPDQLL